jgi:hypothetical protein
MIAVRSCALLLLCLSAGCAKAPFTTAVIERFQLSHADLHRIQFFTSEPVILQRETSLQSRTERGAELVVRDDFEIEAIEVSEHTPCVILRVEGDYLLLGFSPKDERAALWFRAQAVEEAADTAHGRRYVLVAIDNLAHESEPFTPRFTKGFLVHWSGKKYHVVSGRDAYLLYDMDDSFERHKVEYSAPGWRISERPPARAPARPVPAPAASESVQDEP